jgi:hypothetical protein
MAFAQDPKGVLIRMAVPCGKELGIVERRVHGGFLQVNGHPTAQVW